MIVETNITTRISVTSIMKTPSSANTRVSTNTPHGKLPNGTNKERRVRFDLETPQIGAYQENIVTILQNYLNGQDKTHYEEMFGPDECLQLTDTLLITWLQQIKENLFLLTAKAELFVEAMLSIPWAERDPEIVDAYQNFLMNLVSAHSAYTKAVLRMLVKNFTPAPNCHTNDQVVFQVTHQTIMRIVQIVPMSKTILHSLLVDHFPWEHAESAIQVKYVHNLLWVTQYLPEGRLAVLELVISRLVKIDVLATRAAILESEEDATAQEDMFDMEMESSSPTPNSQPAIDQHMDHEKANTLDLLMLKLFEFVKAECHKDNELEMNRTKVLFHELMAVFDEVLLSTHAPAHVQFIIFYLCSFKPLLYEGFIDVLWKKFQNPNSSPLLRQNAAAYMGSFLARANYIPTRVVEMCLEVMCGWIHSYIDKQEAYGTGNADPMAHSAFYALCQSLFYVFVFRHGELCTKKKSLTFAQSLNFERIIGSRLNPLNVCYSPIVTQFSCITRTYQLAYCQTIIERNNRFRLPVHNTYGALGLATSSTTEPFFPFDPYLLVRSNSYIMPLYKECEEYQATSVSAPDDEFLDDEKPARVNPAAFWDYSSSPGFKHL